MTGSRRIVITDEDMGLAPKAPAAPPVAPAPPVVPQAAPMAPAAAAPASPPMNAAPPPPAPFAPTASAAAAPPPAPFTPPPAAAPPLPPAPPPTFTKIPDVEPAEPHAAAAAAVPPPPAPPRFTSGAAAAAPQPIAAGGAPADHGSRLGGFLLDGVFMFAAEIGCFIGFTVIVTIFGVLGLGILGLLLGGIGFIAGMLAAVYFLLALPMARPGDKNGQTYGMSITGTRVVRIDGRPFDKSFALWNYLVGPSLLLAFTFGIGAIANAILPLIDDNRQSLRDKLAKTLARAA